MGSPKRSRFRELLPCLPLGSFSSGPKNSITDIPHLTASCLNVRNPPDIMTGVTAILPNPDIFHNPCFAGIFRFNGNGEMTGSHWINETGLLTSPIMITNTFSIGAVSEGVLEYIKKGHKPAPPGEEDLLFWGLPVVGETYDGYLNDITSFAVRPEHAVKAIEMCSADPLPEGNVGGGSGMICHRFKGGTGSSSRLIPKNDKSTENWTVAAVVQANYGAIQDLHICGVPIGQLWLKDNPPPKTDLIKDGSIIIIIGTDCPLLPNQCDRLAKRATVGLARVGGKGYDSSGDIFLAFSTGNKVNIGSPIYASKHPVIENIQMARNDSIDTLFAAVADCVEEAIYNALCCAESVVGFKGHKIDAIDLEWLKSTLKKHVVFDEKSL